ncbi:hypothetical protein Y032_0745g2010 [Ancylostoma ceylanicum]|uniref:Secreted protein n=1 Tax=Ancylostoma ceylanicum TaxID=53326 RepID=A0A016WEN9_9BILA|nr:hypothetical protein Y032_0745g2010 [Ancylostoma ceylanicum]
MLLSGFRLSLLLTVFRKAGFLAVRSRLPLGRLSIPLVFPKRLLTRYACYRYSLSVFEISEAEDPRLCMATNAV